MTDAIDELAAKLEKLAIQQADIKGDSSYDGKRMLMPEDTMYWAARTTILSLATALRLLLRFGDNHFHHVQFEGRPCALCDALNQARAALAASPVQPLIVEAFTPSGADCHPESPHAVTFKVKPGISKPIEGGERADLVKRLRACRPVEGTNIDDVAAYVRENYEIRHEAAALIEDGERRDVLEQAAKYFERLHPDDPWVSKAIRALASHAPLSEVRTAAPRNASDSSVSPNQS